MCVNIEMERKIDRMLGSVEWIHPESDIYDGSHIAFKTGEIVIRGIVSLAPRKVEVTMESPKAGITCVETIDADMPVIFRTRIVQNINFRRLKNKKCCIFSRFPYLNL